MNPENISQKKIEQALEENMVNKFSYLASQNPNMEIIENENMRIINSRCDADMFNIICKIKNSNPEVLQKAAGYFKKGNLPFAWWIGFNNEPKNLKLELEKLQFNFDEHELGMYVFLDEIPSQNKTSELNIEEINNKKTLNDFIEVISTLIPNDAKAVKNFYESNLETIMDKKNKLKSFVGYLNNKPIATSVLFCDANVVGVWDVMVSPKARGKGIGTQRTLKALQEGKNCGYKIGVLTASDEGQFVYRKLGFNTLKEYKVCNC